VNSKLKTFKQLVYTVFIRIVVPGLMAAFSIFLYDLIDDAGIVASYTSASGQDLMIWQIFYALIATLYAICVAFLLVKEMQDFAELKTSFRKEAFVLKSIHMYLFYLEEDLVDLDGDKKRQRIKVISGIKSSMSSYIKRLLEGDLKGGRGVNVDTVESDIWKSVNDVGSIQVEDENDKIALQKLMEKHEELFMLRATRSGWIDTGLSPYLLFFLLILSAVIVFPFFTFSSVNPMINYVSLGALVFFLSFLMATLIDVGNPFSGHWKIPTKMYEELLENEFKPI